MSNEYIQLSQVDDVPFNKKKEKTSKLIIFNIIFKISIIILLSAITILLTVVSLEIKNKLITLIDNTNELVAIKIPYELNNVHEMIEQHNITFVEIEGELINDLNVIEYNSNQINRIFNNLDSLLMNYNKNFNTPNVTNELLNIISSLNNLLNGANITQTNVDVHSIACSLKILTHDPNPC